MNRVSEEEEASPVRKNQPMVKRIPVTVRPNRSWENRNRSPVQQKALPVRQEAVSGDQERCPVTQKPVPEEQNQVSVQMRLIPLVLSLLTIACDRSPRFLYPDHPTGLAVKALNDTGFTWQTRETEHFRVHFQPGSYAAAHEDAFLKDAEQAREIGLRILGEKDFIPRIDVFHLTSRDQMKRITGYGVRGWADPGSRTVLLVRSGAANQGERHEITHVLSHNLWGPSKDWLTTGWMSEAVATYAGGPCSGYNIDEIVAYLDRQGELIPLDSLALNFRSFNDLVAYLQAGSFIGYLRETYGLQPIRALWERGFDGFEIILGKAPAAADAEWRSHLRAKYPEPKVDWAPLNKAGCQ
jgi:hypothetical protein